MSILNVIDTIFYGVLGMILGILLTWTFNKKYNKKNALGKIIETALIEENVLELEELSTSLIQLMSKIKDSSEELNTQVVNARDIELNLKSHYDSKKINNIDMPLVVEILETKDENI